MSPSGDAYIDYSDGVATVLPLDVRMVASSESLEKAKLFSKSSRAWGKLPLLKKLVHKEGKVNYIGDWREEKEVSHNFILHRYNCLYVALIGSSH